MSNCFAMLCPCLAADPDSYPLSNAPDVGKRQVLNGTAIELDEEGE